MKIAPAVSLAAALLCASAALAQTTAIPVPSDPRARYTLVSQSGSSGGLEVVTRRSGSSGVSYTRRQINCRQMSFRYLGEGDTLEQAMTSANADRTMGPLVEGSISYHVAVFACRRAG